ncbi:MAG: ribonuclease R [Betaproteobacteria bacterium]
MNKQKIPTPANRRTKTAGNPDDPRARYAVAPDAAVPPPERAEILAVLRDRGVPLTADELATPLNVKPHSLLAFHNRLLAMERDGQLLRNRKGELCIVEKLDLLVGRVEGHPDGFGFLVRDDRGPDLFLGPLEMRKVLHGDRASARVTGIDKRGRPEGSIVEVIERANVRVVGRIFEDRGVWFLVAENRRISQDLLIPPDGRKVGRVTAKPGQVVVAELITQPTKHVQAIAHIVEILGNHTDPGMEIEIALRKHDLPHEFSAAAKRQAAKLPTEVRPADLKQREDIRNLALVTIDGETAKDFDDAVYCEPIGKTGRFRLVVAIADVSHYVRDGDALDGDARSRGTSVYFPRRVIPMLPEELSNGLCSLRPNVDRVCVVADMTISATGAIDEYRFYPAVMHSRARLTYTQVWHWLSGESAPAEPGHQSLLPNLRNLYALYQVLAKSRKKRGAIDFETVETVLEFDDQGKILAVHPALRNDAHRLIEECMLAANVCASDLLITRRHPTLFRVHEGPTPEKLTGLRTFLHGVALTIGGGDKPGAKDYARLIERIRDRPDFLLLQTVLLRSLQQAVYTPDNKGHFGLAYEAYAHFTSPIRRYPDLLTHRAIKAVLAGERYAPGAWDQLGAACSMMERRADDASRDVTNWLKCYFMRDRVGEVYNGTVSAVTPFGLFVTLDEVFVDGLLHISELGRDYFHHDPARHTIIGERGGQVFRLADRIRVKVARVDLETSKIDFVLPETVPAPAKAKVK